MDKTDALRIIIECAKLYELNLENKNLLFLSKVNKNKFNFLETLFVKGNYLHLTGIVIINDKISPNVFYEQCLSRKLSVNSFKFKEDGTTSLKLLVLPQLMNIARNSKMIGNFNGSKPKLYADKLTGSVRACMGLSKKGYWCVPVTALKEDIRDLIKEKERVIAVFTKKIHCELYNNLVYTAKGIIIMESDLPKQILDKIDIENLIYDSGVTPVQKNIDSKVINKAMDEAVVAKE